MKDLFPCVISRSKFELIDPGMFLFFSELQGWKYILLVDMFALHHCLTFAEHIIHSSLLDRIMFKHWFN